MRAAITIVLLVSSLAAATAKGASLAQNPYSDATGFDGNISPFIGPPKDGTFDFLNTTDDLSILNSATVESRFAMLFDISSIPDDSTIDGATLYLSERVDPGVGLELHGYSGGAAVTLADMTIANLLTPIVTNGTTETYALDVTAFIQNLLAGGDNSAGFLVRDPGEANLFYSLASLEDPSSGLRPLLSIEFTVVPEPATLTLWSIGVAGLLLVQWRRKR